MIRMIGASVWTFADGQGQGDGSKVDDMKGCRRESHRWEDIGEIIIVRAEDLEFANGESLADKKEIMRKAIGQITNIAQVFFGPTDGDYYTDGREWTKQWEF